MDKSDIKDFAKYAYGFADDMNCEFNLANGRYATRILIESLILIAEKIEGISTRMLILNKALNDINKSLEEING